MGSLLAKSADALLEAKKLSAGAGTPPESTPIAPDSLTEAGPPKHFKATFQFDRSWALKIPCLAALDGRLVLDFGKSKGFSTLQEVVEYLYPFSISEGSWRAQLASESTEFIGSSGPPESINKVPIDMASAMCLIGAINAIADKVAADNGVREARGLAALIEVISAIDLSEYEWIGDLCLGTTREATKRMLAKSKLSAPDQKEGLGPNACG